MSAEITGFEDLLLEQDGVVGRITINRPEKANALRHQTFDELKRAFAQFNMDPTVRVIVLTGAGVELH